MVASSWPKPAMPHRLMRNWPPWGVPTSPGMAAATPLFSTTVAGPRLATEKYLFQSRPGKRCTKIRTRDSGLRHSYRRRLFYEPPKLLSPGRGPLPRDLRTLLAGFRQADGNCLLPALHRSAFASSSRLQGAAFLSPHRASHGLARSLSIFPPAASASRSASVLWHGSPPMELENSIVQEVGAFRIAS